jgi:hypothetical protein
MELREKHGLSNQEIEYVIKTTDPSGDTRYSCDSE